MSKAAAIVENAFKCLSEATVACAAGADFSYRSRFLLFG